MLRQTSLLVSLVALLDWFPWPPEPAKRPRGRPKTYSDRLIMKALVGMIIRRLYTAYALLVFLEQDDAVAKQLRPLLTEHGRLPMRRTWERHLAALPPHLPGLIGSFGRHLVHMFNPWAHHGRAVAVDSAPGLKVKNCPALNGCWTRVFSSQLRSTLAASKGSPL